MCPRAKAMYDMATSEEAAAAITAAFVVHRFSQKRALALALALAHTCVRITGAVVTSEEGLATSAPSYGLVKDVLAVVDALPAELFDRHAEHRPCGLLDKYGAVGMLIGDVLGLPLMPWVLAEPIGKAAAKPGVVSTANSLLSSQSMDTATVAAAAQSPSMCATH